MKNLVLLALTVFALSACDQKGSSDKDGGAAGPESNTCGVRPQKAGSAVELLADGYRLKSCGLSEDKAILLLE